MSSGAHSAVLWIATASASASRSGRSTTTASCLFGIRLLLMPCWIFVCSCTPWTSPTGTRRPLHLTLTVSCVQKRSEVFNIVALRDPTSEGGRAEGVNLYGHQLCIRGCAKLLGASAKKLFKYRKLAGAGQSCPLDGRSAELGLAPSPSSGQRRGTRSLSFSRSSM